MIINKSKLKLIPNSKDQTCFGCGVSNNNGLRMEFFTDSEQLYSFLKIPVSMAGWDRTVHGGIVSTVLDEIMGWGVIYLYKKLGVTKKMTVEFIKPVFADDEITVVGNLEEKKSGKSIIMSSQIYNSDSFLCATASAEFKALDPKIALRLGLVSDEYMRMFDPILNFNYED